MKYFVLLLSLLTASCNADWIQDQQADDVYYPGMTGMANIGDYIRVNSLDANGEVDTMEALQPGEILYSFDTAQAILDRSAKLFTLHGEPNNSDLYVFQAYLNVAKNSTEYRSDIVYSKISIKLHADSSGNVDDVSAFQEYVNIPTGNLLPALVFFSYKINSDHIDVYVTYNSGNDLISVSGYTLKSDGPRPTFYTNSDWVTIPTGLTNINVANIEELSDSGDVYRISNTDGDNLSLEGYSGDSGFKIDSSYGVVELKTFNGDILINSAIGNIELNTDNGLTISGSTIDIISGESWNAAPLQNGWVNYGSPYTAAAYRKMPDGRIEIKGLVRYGSSVGDTIFNLPSGYRPSENRIFSVASAAGYTRLDISSGGNVLIVTGGSTSWTSIEISFYP